MLRSSRQRPPEHDHSQRLAGTLGVLDNAALARSVEVKLA